MKTKTLKQTISLEATPLEIYNILLDSEKHSELTKSEVITSKSIGDTFSTYNGYITGVNLELVPGKKIVQSWKANENGWPENHFSIITIEFEKTIYGTLLHFTHENVPELLFEQMDKGWIDYYWMPLQKLIEEENNVI